MKSILAYGYVLSVIVACQDASDSGISTRCSEVSDDTAIAAQPIYGGTEACESLGAKATAVGYVLVSDPFDTNVKVSSCTLTRIGFGVALTAKHCFSQNSTFMSVVGFGSAIADTSGCGNGVGETKVIETKLHPDADLALVRFIDVSGSPVVQLGEPPVSTISDVTLAGYGLNESGTLGERRCVESEVIENSTMLITLSDKAGSGACVGDSGGPLLRISATGEPELIGVLNGGSASCTGRDQYTPVAPHLQWLDIEANEP
jgi:hypothetical protein